MYSEDDLLPLSGLQHLMFCERQWGLIHIEQIWEENKLTAEGRVLHERAHLAGSESRPAVRTARGLRLRSLTLGLAGQADIVEFFPSPKGVHIPGLDGFWQPHPVEYKRGKPKKELHDKVQLCAQALCMEEMFGAAIFEGAFFYGETRRRTRVEFNEQLREVVRLLALRMHALHLSEKTPIGRYEPKCDSCSLLVRCMPRLLAKPPSVTGYLTRALASGDD